MRKTYTYMSDLYAYDVIHVITRIILMNIEIDFILYFFHYYITVYYCEYSIYFIFNLGEEEGKVTIIAGL